MNGAHRFELAERFAALDRVADVGELHGDDLADRVLALIGDAELGALRFGTHPEMIVAEAQYRNGIALPLLLLLFGRHRALLTKGRFSVSSPVSRSAAISLESRPPHFYSRYM